MLSIPTLDTLTPTLIKREMHPGFYDEVSTKLYDAVYSGCPKDVRILIREHGNKWLKDQLYLSIKIRKSLFELAAVGILRSSEITDVFLKIVPGIINARNREGEGLLHVAVQDCDRASVEFLLKKKADPNIINFQRETPLHQAISSSTLVVEVLLKHKANLTLKDEDGYTPIDKYRIVSHEEQWDPIRKKDMLAVFAAYQLTIPPLQLVGQGKKRQLNLLNSSSKNEVIKDSCSSPRKPKRCPRIWMPSDYEKLLNGLKEGNSLTLIAKNFFGGSVETSHGQCKARVEKLRTEIRISEKEGESDPTKVENNLNRLSRQLRLSRTIIDQFREYFQIPFHYPSQRVVAIRSTNGS